MNSVVKTMNKQTTTAKHAKEMTARFCTFRSLTWDNQFIVISVTTGLQNIGSNLASELCQNLLTNKKLLPDLTVAPYSSSLPQDKGISLPPSSVRITFRRFPVPNDNQLGLDLCHDQVKQVKEKFLISETHRY